MRLTLGLAVCLLAALFTAPSRAAENRRPNVLIIVSDDQGFEDLGVQGSPDIPTPHIDSIAHAGVRCTNGYVTGPYCSPTRAGLMAGRYQTRFGHEFNPAHTPIIDPNFGLALTEHTLADRLQAAGYATGMVGKWHLGYTAPFHPLKRGFEEYFGFLGGSHDYNDWEADKANIVMRGTERVVEQTYMTDAFGREAAAYLDRHAGQSNPWFLYWTFNAVHVPLEATKKYLDRFPNIADEKRRTYAAMTSAMDDAVGLILGKLHQYKIEQDTLVFYISDNGGHRGNASSNRPLRGYKSQTLEGGIHVPFFVMWPGHLPAGKTYDKPVIQLDIHATALSVAGVKITPDMKLEGVDLLPYLRGDNTAVPHDALYWRFGEQRAIRSGDWKLVRHDESPNLELYNLAADIGESNDLASAQPDKVRELQAKWDAWNTQNVPPAWPRPEPADKKKKDKPAKKPK